jgi:hypothetical protein
MAMLTSFQMPNSKSQYLPNDTTFQMAIAASLQTIALKNGPGSLISNHINLQNGHERNISNYSTLKKKSHPCLIPNYSTLKQE